MDVTIRQVLQSPVISRARPHVLGRGRRLDDPVHGVHMAESADLAGLLEGGELILSSGVVLDGSAEHTGAFLRGLQQAGAAGVVLSFLSANPAAKEALRQAARTVDLPVILLDDRARFIDVLDTVRDLVREPAPAPVDADSVTQLLSSPAARRLAPRELVSALAAALGRPLALEDADGQVVQHAGLGPETMVGLLDAAADGTAGDGRVADGTVGDSASADGPRLVVGEEPWSAFPVVTGETVRGRLVSPLGAESASLADAMEEAGRLLGERMERHGLTMAQCRRESRTRLLDAVRTGRRSTERAARLDAALLGVRGAEHFVVAVLALPGGEDSIASRALLGAGVEAAEAVCPDALTLPLPTAEFPAVGLVLGLRRGEEPSALLDALAHELERTGGAAARWLLGTGAPVPTLGDAARDGLDIAYRVAHSAVSAPPGPSRVVRPKDLGFRWLARRLVETEEGTRYVQEHLAPFLAEPELLAVLEAHLATGGNIAELARRVHLSRPSVYARLRRITDDLDVDLDDPEVRTSLHVALILHRMTHP